MECPIYIYTLTVLVHGCSDKIIIIMEGTNKLYIEHNINNLIIDGSMIKLLILCSEQDIKITEFSLISSDVADVDRIIFVALTSFLMGSISLVDICISSSDLFSHTIAMSIMTNGRSILQRNIERGHLNPSLGTMSDDRTTDTRTMVCYW
uniref:Uncharacterized protein n=1 Tax=Glypta fumiferanae TaxID=389681 RepID=A0A0F6Q8E5_9HYME|nr:hypothetical protein [Glypta fumiferanae]